MVVLALPGIVLTLIGAHPSAIAGALLYGPTILASAFLLAWAAEALQVDVSQGLAIALVALIAVLPESRSTSPSRSDPDPIRRRRRTP
ncbi:MAG: hypothetical protein ABR509_03630 [Candidatus Limnocylindria bacterium]